jgi:large repetitive protein
MRSEPSTVNTAECRTRSLAGRRREAARKQKQRQCVLESLEQRSLLAVIPGTQVAAQIAVTPNFEPSNANNSSPSIAVDPTNAQHLATVWQTIYPVTGGTHYGIDGAFSTDGGTTWTSFSPGGVLADPTTSNPTVPYSRVTDGTVDFDRSGNIYVLVSQHNDGNGSGALVLSKFATSSGTPVSVYSGKVVYAWTADQAIKPTMTVDKGVATFTDTYTDSTGAVVTKYNNDASAGNVYVAWGTVDVAPPNVQNWNPNTVRLVSSSDGGVTFSGAKTVGLGNFGSQREGAPRIVTSQGTAAVAGGTPTVAGGLVTVVWDDWGSGATATPTPFDFINSRTYSGPVSQSFSAAQGAIADAGASNAPTTTDFPITVSTGANFGVVTDVTVSIAIAHPADAELTLVLVAPDDTLANPDRVTLVANNTASGANFGYNFGSASMLTTNFNMNTFHTIPNGAAPYIGTFRPAGNLAQWNNRAVQNGQWHLLATDSTTNNVGFLFKGTVTFTGSTTTTSSVRNVATTTVRGQQGAGGLVGSAAEPQGIGPAPAIAADNTLGGNSPYAGRIYVTYVDRSTALGNPADNTDIYMKTSDDGGLTWSGASIVNDDRATADGFSEANGFNAGRAQFEPAVAVDQATGTLVVTYYDGRYDAARSRVAQTIATSIDGGGSFTPQNGVFANAKSQAFDQATNTTVTLGPIPDNNSGGNNATGKDAVFGFGDHQGLAVLDGHVYPAWSSNQNGGADGKALLQIRVAQGAFAAGPRIVSGTMGPVGLSGDTLNGNTAADGGPTANSVVVTFDRPVDPATFTTDVGTPDVTVYTTNFEAGAAGWTFDNNGADPVLGTVANGLWHFSTGRSSTSGHTPTHSLYYGQNESASGGGNYNVVVNGNPVANSGSVLSPQIALPAGGNLQLSLNYLLQTEGATSIFDAARISIIDVGTGTATTLAANQGGILTDPTTGFKTLAVNIPNSFSGKNVEFSFSFNTVDSILNNFEGWYVDDVTVTQLGAPADFTIVGRDANGVVLPANLQPQVTAITPLNLGTFGPASANGATQFRIDFSPASIPGTYSYAVGPDISDRIRQASANGIQTSAGNAMDQNGNAVTGETRADRFAAPQSTGSTPLVAPYVRDQLPLVVPGPHVVSYQAENQQSGASDHLVLNGTTTYLDVTFDRDMNPLTFTPDKMLRIEGPAGLITGPFTVAAQSTRTFRIGFPKQQLSGTYTITLDSGIQSASGYALDTNLNAGVDALRGTSTSAPVSLKYNSTVPVTIAPGRTGSSTITVPDDFILQGLTLQLNITSAYDPALTAKLVAPDGTTILLFQNVGSTGTQANFSNTIFDDSATTPITNGGPAFLGRFRPMQSLSVLNNGSSYTGPGTGPNFPGTGVYTLQMTNAANGKTTTITNWSLMLLKPTSGTGLGEPVADRPQLSFRIFTMNPTNPLASQTWTSVGPASIGQGRSGRIGGMALDPSDPSGNTLYVGGASGGIWKTNNFLTTDSQGPTYIPLTDFGPTFGINIGGLAVAGVNNDPNKSMVFVATGEGDSGTTGVGVLRSMDGGASWTLLDSTNNNLPYAQRDHAFVGSTAFKILVDPNPTASGQTIVYMALSGNNGGIWRSLDSGQTWGVLNGNGQRVANFSGQATDIVLDPGSGTPSPNNPTGNLQIVYAALRGQGVYLSPNQGQSWNLMTGGVGDPLIQDLNPIGSLFPKPIPVGNLGVNPNGAQGRIVLAKPDLFPASDPNAALKNFIYQGWLYAVVVTPNDHFFGLFVTKDQGQNWTKVRVPNLPPVNGVIRLAPSNDTNNADYDVLANSAFAQGNYDVSLAVDPTNPNVVYIGGTSDGNPTGLIRVDITGLSDPHSFYLGMDRNDGGTLYVNSTDPMTLKPVSPFPPGVSGFDPRNNPTINLIRDPSNPLGGNATFYVDNVSNFANSGAGAKWVSFSSALGGSSDQHRVLAFRDPLTGHARLIFGDDQGVFSGVDNGDGTLSSGIGTAPSPGTARNGNLQITQFYYGTAQPSSAAAQIAGALFYGSAQDDGAPHSSSDVLNSGNLSWGGPGGDYTGVATDQVGSGTVYQYGWPCCGGNITDFFLVNGVGRTNGLIQQASGGTVPDPQWPFLGGFNFGVNPINADQVVISSAAGRVFRTLDQGKFWQVVAEPTVLDGTNAPALTFGAPDPNAPTLGSLANFIYAGTNGGHIYVTFTGGGSGQGNAWINITNGDLATDGSSVHAIVANPTRGSREAFAVTSNGVYYISDSNPANGATWQRITSNLFSIQQNPFGNSALANNKLAGLTSIVADWRYVIPDSAAVNSPTHPMLYVAGNGGVYRSTDKGATWLLFPQLVEPGSLDTTAGLNIPLGNGGGLPNALVSDLDMSIGNVDPTTGRSIAAPGDPNVLLATTYGRGSFAIRLAPVVFASQIKLDAALPAPGGSANGGTASDGTPQVIISQPYFDGLSEQTAFGNVVRITFWDLTDPANPRIVGGYDPNTPSTDVAANRTDSFGKYSIQINAGAFTTNGLKSLGIQATDLSGTKGNMALFAFTLKANLNNVNQPPVPPTIQMLGSDDSSGGLLITNVAQPHIIGVTDPNLGQPTPTATSKVELILVSQDGVAKNTVLVTGKTDAQGSFVDPNPAVSPGLLFPNLGDHTYVVRVVATNPYGSSTSPNLTFTIKHNAPSTPVTLLLQASDDTGIQGDWVTSNRFPHFTGTAEAGAVVRIYRVDSSGNRGQILATTTAGDSGNGTGPFSIQLPQALANGTITLQAGETDVAGNQGPFSNQAAVTIVTTQDDLIGAGKTTPNLFRRASSGNALWLAQGTITSPGWTTSGVPPTSTQTFGSSTLDIPFVGDFDGDGLTDIAIYRPSANTWVVERTQLGQVAFALGTPGHGNIPVAGDFDGDGITDVGVYDPTNGKWTIAESTVGTVTLGPIGSPVTPMVGDVPVPGNYDNTGKAELAIYRPAASAFFILGPSGVYAKVVSTGGAGDVPVPGDYNNSFTVSAGQPTALRPTEAAVFNPTTGVWAIVGPTGVVTTVSPAFQPGDVPAPGDYLGTGSLQPAVYRPSDGKFYINNGGAVTTVSLGLSGDIPVTSPLIYRSLLTQPTIALAAASDTGIKGDGMTSGRRDANGVRWIDLTGKTDAGVAVDVVNVATGKVIASATADANGAYTASISGLSNGVYNLRAQARGLSGATSAPSTTLTVTLVTVDGDYNGDGKTEQALFARNATSLNWYVLGLPLPVPVSFGMSALDVPLSGDLSGGGKTDLIYYRPSTAQWYAEQSASGYANTLLATFGWGGVDIPVPADYNGDGTTDLAVYRPKVGSTTDGYWFLALSNQANGLAAPPITTAQVGDVPVPGDYENVGHAEAAIFRPGTTSQWLIKDVTNPTSVLRTIGFGTTGDIPVPGAYDATATNHAVEPAVFRPSTGQWFVRASTGTQRIYQFNVGDIPAPGDYNGDGVTDAVVFRPSTGQWLTILPGATTASVLAAPYGIGSFGWSATTPVNTPYHYRQVTGANGTISVLGAATTGSGSGGSKAVLDLGSTARNLANGNSGSLTPVPAASPTKVNLHTRARHVKVPAKVALHARQATVAQNGGVKKTPGQLF